MPWEGSQAHNFVRGEQSWSQAPIPRSLKGLRDRPRTDVPFPSLLGAFAYRFLTAIGAQQRAGGALSANRDEGTKLRGAANRLGRISFSVALLRAML